MRDPITSRPALHEAELNERDDRLDELRAEAAAAEAELHANDDRAWCDPAEQLDSFAAVEARVVAGRVAVVNAIFDLFTRRPAA